MQRIGTVLVALLAVFALAAAAGSYTTADQPSLRGSDASGTGAPADSGVETGGDAPSAPAGDGGGEQVGDRSERGATGDSGGVSALVVALFTGALLACAVVAVLLTGDDDRAPRPNDGTDERRDPGPSVDVHYGPPPDNAVVRAWERLIDAVDGAATDAPGETARRATERGFPVDAVSRLRRHFLDVRYGNEPAEGREREVRDALADLDRGEEP